jgi:N-acetylglutamate synthase-like GNAT family acetyltransferase
MADTRNDLKIKVMKETDVGGVLHLIATVWGDEVLEAAEEDLRAMFHYSSAAPEYVIAVLDGEVVGLCGHGQSLRDWNVQAIFWVSVAPDKQRRGIGSILMERVIQSICSDQNARAVELTTQSPKYFERHGFRSLYDFIAPNNTDPYYVMVLKVNGG